MSEAAVPHEQTGVGRQGFWRLHRLLLWGQQYHMRTWLLAACPLVLGRWAFCPKLKVLLLGR